MKPLKALQTIVRKPVFLLSIFFISHCGMATSSKDVGDLFLSFLGKSPVPANQMGPSPIAEEGVNTPVSISPPDEVLATNPPPPPFGDIVPRNTTGSSSPYSVGPMLKVEVGAVNYTGASQYDFLARQVNTHEDKTFTLRNEGDQNLQVTSFQVVSAGSQFQWISGFSGGTIAPNATVTFVVRFQPNSVGLRSGQLQLVTNDPRTNVGLQPLMASYTLTLRGSGTLSPTATIVKTATSVSRFQRIVIEFSHEMDRGTICPVSPGTFGTATYSHRGGGNQIRLRNLTNNTFLSGRCTWTGFRQLVLQPYSGLDPLTNYRIELDDALLHITLSGTTPDDKLVCAGLVQGSCNSNRRAQFQTEPKFEATLSINGKEVTGPNAAGIVMVSSTHTTVTLSGTLSESFAASSIRIKKVGVDPSVFHPWNGSSNVNLTTLSGGLQPHQGSNGYYVEIISGGKTYIRNFGFNWGTLQSNPMTTPVLSGGRVNIGSGVFGVNQIARLLEKFIQSNGDMAANSGNFQLDGRIFSRPILEKSGNTSHNSATITSINTTGLQVGMAVRGRSIQPNTRITSIGTNSITISPVAHDDHGTAGSNRKLTFGPDFIKTANITNGSDQIVFSDNVGLIDSGGNLLFRYFVSASNNGIPDGTFLLERISGTTYRMSQSATANGTGVAISYSPGFQQNPRRTSLPITTGNCLNNPSDFRLFSWIPTFGPFCDIPWSWAFGANGKTDVYVTNITIENTAPGDPLSRNILVGMSPNTSRLDVTLSGKRLRGTLRAHIHSASFTAWIAGAQNNIFDIDFIMNFDGSSCNDSTVFYDYSVSKPFRVATARSTLNVPTTNGRLNLAIQNPPWNSPTNVDFHVNDWNAAICAHNVVTIKGGWLNSLVTAILGSVIPNIQWIIVQGVLRDTLQTVTPNILNALFTQLRIDATNNGIGVRLPNYLPDPFNRTKLFIGANLRQDTTHRTGSDGIDLGADIGILACMNPNSTTDTCLPNTPPPVTLLRPALHTGTGFGNSFVLSGGSLPASQLAAGPVNGNQGTGLIASHPGVLLAVRMDVINQVLYNLWRKGIFELSLDQNFANQVEAYRGNTDRLFQIFQTLLKAENLLRVLAPGQSVVYYGPGPNDKIDGNDDIIFRLKPFTPPNIRPAHMSHAAVAPSSGGRKYSLADLEWNDLFIEIWGKRSDNTQYKISTLRINFLSRAGINIHTFSSPVNSGANNYQNVTSIQLNVCDDNVNNPSTFDCDLLRTTNLPNDDLIYTLEVMDNPIDNPLGLDPRGIHEVLDPSVQKLILPVVNFVLEELPLEEKSFSLPTHSIPNQPGTREDPNHPNNKIMANCGIRLGNMSVQPIPPTTPAAYVLIHTQLVDYTFSENCRL